MKIERAIPLNDTANANDRLKAQEKQLQGAAKMYEQHFLNEMMRTMRQSIHEGDFMKSSFGEKIFREQLDTQYVEKWSDRGGVGLAEMIYKNIKEKYLPDPNRPLAVPKGPLPLESKAGSPLPKLTPLPSQNSKETNLLFRPIETPAKTTQVTSPWDGVVKNQFQDSEGLAVVELQHDQGLESRMVFTGTAEKLSSGTKVAAGQVVGMIKGVEPWLQWRLDPTS